MRFTLTHIIFTGQITGPSFHVSPWNNHYVDYENPDNSELQLELNSDYAAYGELNAYDPGHYSFYVEGIGDYSGIIQIDWQLGNDGTITDLVLDSTNTSVKIAEDYTSGNLVDKGYGVIAVAYAKVKDSKGNLTVVYSGNLGGKYSDLQNN